MPLRKLILSSLSQLFFNQCTKEDELALPYCIEQKIEALKKKPFGTPQPKSTATTTKTNTFIFFPALLRYSQ